MKIVLEISQEKAEELLTLVSGEIDSLSDYEEYVVWLQEVREQLQLQVILEEEEE